MLADITKVDNIYMVCGYTDMRKSIDGLCAVVEEVVKRDYLLQEACLHNDG